MLYLVSFGAGLSSVPWVVNSEIYPQRVRSAGMAQAVVANWLLNFLVSETFLSLAKVWSRLSPSSHPPLDERSNRL